MAVRRRSCYWRSLALRGCLFLVSLPHRPPSRQCPIRLRETLATYTFAAAGICGDQYQDYKRGVPVLTGFDIEIERALARIMNVEIALPQIAWENHLAALAAGDADIAAGATESEARSRYAYFSKPYRTETDVLILPRGTSGRYPFRTIEEMLDTFAKRKFRLGIVAGFVYADQRVNAFIADPANRDRIFPVESKVQNLRNLQDGTIDGFCGVAAQRRFAHRRAPAALHHRYTFHAEPSDADAANAGAPR